MMPRPDHVEQLSQYSFRCEQRETEIVGCLNASRVPWVLLVEQRKKRACIGENVTGHIWRAAVRAPPDLLSWRGWGRQVKWCRSISQPPGAGAAALVHRRLRSAQTSATAGRHDQGVWKR